MFTFKVIFKSIICPEDTHKKSLGMNGLMYTDVYEQRNIGLEGILQLCKSWGLGKQLWRTTKITVLESN